MMVAKPLPLLLFVVILTSGCGSASTPPSQLSALPSTEAAQHTAFPATTAASEPEAGFTLVPTVPLQATINAPPTQRAATETPASPTAITVTSAIYPSPWMTYINHEYGFQIDYPDGFALGQEFISLGISDVVVSFRFPDLPQYASFEFKEDVIVAYVEISVAARDDLDPLLEAFLAGSETVESGSTVFQNYVASDNAMGGWYGHFDYYSLPRGDLLYTISLSIHGKGPGAGANNGQGPLPEDYASPAAKEAFYSVLYMMLASFNLGA